MQIFLLQQVGHETSSFRSKVPVASVFAEILLMLAETMHIFAEIMHIFMILYFS